MGKFCITVSGLGICSDCGKVSGLVIRFGDGKVTGLGVAFDEVGFGTVGLGGDGLFFVFLVKFCASEIKLSSPAASGVPNVFNIELISPSCSISLVKFSVTEPRSAFKTYNINPITPITINNVVPGFMVS